MSRHRQPYTGPLSLQELTAAPKSVRISARTLREEDERWRDTDRCSLPTTRWTSCVLMPSHAIQTPLKIYPVTRPRMRLPGDITISPQLSYSLPQSDRSPSQKHHFVRILASGKRRNFSSGTAPSIESVDIREPHASQEQTGQTCLCSSGGRTLSPGPIPVQSHHPHLHFYHSGLLRSTFPVFLPKKLISFSNSFHNFSEPEIPANASATSSQWSRASRARLGQLTNRLEHFPHLL
ncbi:hypothetical protein BDZ97DRAFT_213427 [Flammula alnicola]|nr:hypothetical protein BDZ97DRAFT_213427 [Flammula alnicola]